MNYEQYKEKFEDDLNEAWGNLSDSERRKYFGANPFESFCYELWRNRE